MDARRVVALLSVLVAASLVGAPATMADWGQQASLSVERIDRSQVREETPVLQYGDLSPDARQAVTAAIESPDGRTTVYGREDWPDRFFYSDYTAPGQGMYAVVYEGQYYRLTTYAGGGFPFVYWLYELPFVAYGLVLAWGAAGVYRDGRSALPVGVAAVAGVGFHLLGPAFDFPVVSPKQFIGLGAAAAVLLGLGLGLQSVRGRDATGAE